MVVWLKRTATEQNIIEHKIWGQKIKITSNMEYETKKLKEKTVSILS